MNPLGLRQDDGMLAYALLQLVPLCGDFLRRATCRFAADVQASVAFGLLTSTHCQWDVPLACSSNFLRQRGLLVVLLLCICNVAGETEANLPPHTGSSTRQRKARSGLSSCERSGNFGFPDA